jgi:uncharacterized protein (TIRG00374 family)
LDWVWLTAAALVVLLSYVGRAIRWQVLLWPVKRHSSFRNVLTATVIGFTAIVLLGRPGELVRPYLVATKEGVSFSSQMAAWLLERIYDLLVAIALFGLALHSIQLRDHSGLSPALAWTFDVGGQLAAVVSLGCLAALVALGRYPDLIRERILTASSFLPSRYQDHISEFTRKFSDGVRSTGSKRAVTLVLTYTILEWLVIVIAFLFLLWSVPETSKYGLRQAICLLGFVAFGSIVQIPGIGGGIQIVTIIVLTELFRVPLEAATGLALIIWITTFVTVVPFGLFLALREGLSWRRISHLEESAES